MRRVMIGGLLMAAGASVAALVVQQWHDLMRYLRIRQM
jgi:hypothetical protein